MLGTAPAGHWSAKRPGPGRHDVRGSRCGTRADGRRDGWRQDVAGIAVTLLGLCLAAIAPPVAGAEPQAGARALPADPILAFRRSRQTDRFGQLVFLGGLSLKAPRDGSFRGFGGLSAVAVSDDGRGLVILSDLGHVLTARLIEAKGRPLSLADARMVRRLGPDGAPARSKAVGDAEAIATLGGTRPGHVVAVESAAALLLYPAGTGGLAGRPRPLPTPPRFAYFVRRGGLEALAVAPPASPVAGDLVIFLEKVLDGETRTRGWRATPHGGDPADLSFTPFTLRQDPEWSVTGAAFLAGGDLLILERRYRGGFDLSIRVRRIGRDALTGDRLDGTVLMEADLAHEIDNLEGLAVHAGADGRPVLTLVSDDNRRLFQRTLLLRFALDTPVPRPRPERPPRI